jgi:hypothetical protein
MELEPQRNDLRRVDGGQGHDGHVAAAFELKGDGDQGVDVAEGAYVGEDDAQVLALDGRDSSQL